MLPIILIVGLALTVYIPSLLLSTKYNFVYTSCSNRVNYEPYNCESYLQKRYSVIDDKITVNTVDMTMGLDNKKSDINQNYTSRIFLHDTEKNESREITFEEAQDLALSSLITSPDGVAVSSGYSGGSSFIFGGSSSSYGYYLTKGKRRQKLNLINNTDEYYSQNNIHFIGWVLPGRN